MKPSEIVIDPKIKDLILPLSDAERAQLEANIKNDGVIIKPVVVWKGRGILLDGHNRKEIGESLGIKYQIVEIDLPDYGAAAQWVADHQAGQRNLTDYQRVQLALKLEPILAEQAMERKKAGTKLDLAPNSAQGETRDAVAKAAGVSHGTVAAVKTVEAKAAEPLRAMAEAAEVSPSAAATVAGALPKADQRKLASQGPAAVVAAASAIREGRSVFDDEDETPEVPKLSEWEQVAVDTCGIVSVLRSVADTMRKCYGAQAKGSEKTLTKPGAARYTWTGTVGSVNELIRYLESNIPVGEKGGQIVTAHDVEFEKKVNGRKGNG